MALVGYPQRRTERSRTASPRASQSSVRRCGYPAHLKALTEWRWSGTRSDGQSFEMRGVTLFEIADDQIVARRLYMEDVERDVAGIEQAVEALSGRRPRPAQQ